MRSLLIITGVVAWLAVGCGGTQPEPEQPEDDAVVMDEPTLPPPLPPPVVRCSAQNNVTASIKADRLYLLEGEQEPAIVLAGPTSVRFAELGDDGALSEASRPLVKLRRSSAYVAAAGPANVVVVEAARAKRGKSRLTVSRFARDGDRIGKSLSVERSHVASSAVDVECSAQGCLLVWLVDDDEQNAPTAVARYVAFSDEGVDQVGEEPLTLPGQPSFMWRQGDDIELVVGEKQLRVSHTAELSSAESLDLPRGGHLKLAESPTGARASFFVESAMPYGMVVAVQRASGGEPRSTRLWEQASQEGRIDLAAGQQGFGSLWAKPQGETGPYAEASSSDAVKVFFRGFSTSGVPHGEELALTEEPVKISAVTLAGMGNGYVAGWTSPHRARNKSKVTVVQVSCRELTGEEADAERAREQELAESEPDGEADGGPEAAPDGGASQ